jgi:D-sedoheptulose 7-phosphate isomerase
MFDASFAEHLRVAEDTRRAVVDSFPRMQAAWIECIRAGGKILFFGNGGSACDAQHLATELVVRYRDERRALGAIALSSNASLITAASNDLGFERVFSRQIEALGRSEDLAVGITTSGASANVLAALRTARSLGLRTGALTGSTGGEITQLADVVVSVPSSNTARVQEMHILLGHMWCAALERALVGDDQS